MLQIIDIKIKKLKTHVPIFCPKNNKLSLGQKKKKKKATGTPHKCWSGI
jgi:hypothetical protein